MVSDNLFAFERSHPPIANAAGSIVNRGRLTCTPTPKKPEEGERSQTMEANRDEAIVASVPDVGQARLHLRVRRGQHRRRCRSLDLNLLLLYATSGAAATILVPLLRTRTAAPPNRPAANQFEERRDWGKERRRGDWASPRSRFSLPHTGRRGW
jgi:hypothetical protein